MARPRKKAPNPSVLALRKGRREARSKRRVSNLAKSAGLSWELSICILRSSNIQVHGASDLVPKRDVSRALDLLKEGKRQQSHQTKVDKSSVSKPLITQIEKESFSFQASVKTRERQKNQIVGKKDPDNISYLSINDIKTIHNELVRDFQNSNDPIDPPGVKDETLLGSAVNRPWTSIGDEMKYPTVSMAASAYLHALIGNHPFHNGNKRTALVSTLAFLSLNNRTLDGVDKDDLYKYVIKIASHEVCEKDPGERLADREMSTIAEWIETHSRPISSKEKMLKVHELRTILKKYDCTIDRKHGNKATAKRENYTSHFGYKNDGDELDRETIRRIRRELHLTEQDGIDSITFYKAESQIPKFLIKYQQILRRLAHS